MRHRLNELRNGRDKGFTLIELLVVVVIIGVLIAIAIPLYLNYTKSSKDTAAQSDLRGAISTLELCNADSAYPTAFFGLAASGTAGTCTTQKIKLSANTTFAYSPNGTGYVVEAQNAGGNKTVYCYDSTVGTNSSVRKTAATAVASAAFTTCPS